MIAEAFAGVQSNFAPQVYAVGVVPGFRCKLWIWASRPLSKSERAKLMRVASTVSPRRGAQPYADAVVSLVTAMPFITCAASVIEEGP